MKKIDDDILELLNDEDIKLIISKTKTDRMLVPFKQNSKTYAKYIQRLGRMDGKSKMAKANLPGIVYELYNKGDLNMRKLLSNQSQLFKSILVEMLAENETEDLSPRKFSSLDALKCVEILSDIESKDGNQVDIDLLFLQLKLNTVEMDDTKKDEIKQLWNEQKKLREAEKKRKEELDSVVKSVEDTYKSEIRNIKKEYESKINSAEKEIRNLEAEIEKKKSHIEELTEDISNQKKENFRKDEKIKVHLEKIKDLNRQLEEKKKEIAVAEESLKEIYEKVNHQRDEFETLWKKDLEVENKNLLKIKNQLASEKESIQTQLDFFLEEKCKAEEELKRLNEEVMVTREQLSVLRTNIDVFAAENENFEANDVNSTAAAHSVGLKLYVERGTNVIQKEKCEKYSQYVMAVETNLDIVGCKISSGKLEDFFNAAVDTGLVPTLCGFGARKLAMALIAARYGEIPTVISVPSGYSDIGVLSREIDEAESEVVIIEDLFGRMNEEIILPVLRRDIDKQLVFCVEGFECLKYIDAYFWNYIQLIKVDIISHKRMSALVFADAKNLFHGYGYSEKSEMHKKVKKLLKDITISDIYVQSRGDVLAYLDEVVHHGTDAVFAEWFEHELLWILKPDQKKILKERLSKNSLGFSNELIEKFG